MWRLLSLCILAGLVGCQSIREVLLEQHYPPAYADGFAQGCSSGHQAGGSINGSFKKDVPRYLNEALYSAGWDDGFRQCQAMQQSDEQRDWQAYIKDEREQDWQRHKDQAMAQALRKH